MNRLQLLSARMTPLASRAADMAPIVPACCNACRTCAATNIVGLVAGGAVAVSASVAALVRRVARVG